jgi:hypothetical protein
MSACDQVVDALVERRLLDAPLRAHLDACRECRAVVAADESIDALADAPADDDDDDAPLPPALRAALARDARPVEPFRPWRRALPVAAVTVAVMAFALAVMPRADLAHQPAGRVALGVGASLAGVAASLAVLLHGGRRGLGLPAVARWAFAAAALACFEVVTAAVTVGVDGSVHLGGAAAWQARLGCALFGSLFALLAGALMFYGARRSAAASPTAAGAVAGLGAGLVGALAQHLHCPVMDLDHTLVAHAAPVVLGALLGALAGRRWLAP